jgi:hypothetical protein
MFFLLRMAFWLGVVCVLLPSGGNKQADPESQIDAVQAVTLASAAVSDMRGFCERQPDACKVGGKVAVAIGHKAEAGARTIYEFVTATIAEKSQPAPAAQNAVAEKPTIRKPATQNAADRKTAGQKPARVVQASARARGTLRPDDLAPAWHEPVPLPPQRLAPHRIARAN